MLRRFVLAFAVAQFVVALVLFAVFHAAIWAAAYLGVNACIVIAAIALERRRYRPAIAHGEGDWETTGERFVDPTTGRLMAVRYNARTGQRDYEQVLPDP